MQATNIIDDKSLEKDFYKEVQQQNKKYVNWVIILGFFTTMAYIVVMMLRGGLPLLFSIKYALLVNLIFIPIIFAVLGLGLALLPYKGLSWQQKYKRVTLLAILVFDIAYLSGMFFVGLVLMYKYHVS